jgi:hypothetical protein
MNWYGISALRALGLAWDIKLSKFKPAGKMAELLPMEDSTPAKLVSPVPAD